MYLYDKFKPNVTKFDALEFQLLAMQLLYMCKVKQSRVSCIIGAQTNIKG